MVKKASSTAARRCIIRNFTLVTSLTEAWLRSVAVLVPTIANRAGAALERRWNRLAASAPVNGSWPVSGVDAEQGGRPREHQR
jgi:hypothetical protein